MRKQLVFVHGRAQGGLEAAALKADWIAAWQRGLAKSGLSVPLDEREICFPFYGDTLSGLTDGAPAGPIADAIVRGRDTTDDEKSFLRAVLEEMRHARGLSDDQIEAEASRRLIGRGLLVEAWLLGILRALDLYVPGASAASIALATHDVFQYLKNPVVKDRIDDGVRAALPTDAPAVVVAHSLGTVVAYDLLRRGGSGAGLRVPLFVTLGSPLALEAIKRALRPVGFPRCAERWYNAIDRADVVALYPLDAGCFAVTPAIENKVDVSNHTHNRHGIAGYLDDADVARRIYDALR